MSLEHVICPVCKQKLAVISYVTVGADVVCANPTCLTTLRVESRRPLKVAVVPVEQTHTVDGRPESYG
jgi:uncharacterized protein YbaR (Trm112 family)